MSILINPTQKVQDAESNQTVKSKLTNLIRENGQRCNHNEERMKCRGNWKSHPFDCKCVHTYIEGRKKQI